MITAKELLNELRAKGITFQYEDGKLRYAGPKGVLTAEHLARLKELRDELIEIIKQDNSSAPGSISRISRDRDLEVSYVQQQLWFLGQLMGPNHVYNLPLAIKLRGKLDVNTLKRAADALLERHESLRTSFEERDSRPVMVVHAKTTLPFRIEDISNISKDKMASECERIITDEATTFFDLSRAPLFRGMLLVLGNDEYIFLITTHHIISDGWSMVVIINDFAHLYNKELNDHLPSLPPHQIQYADFAAWQRESLSKDKIEEEVKYWKNKLEAVPAISSMPLDKPRPSVQSFAGDAVSLAISPDLTARLQEKARELRTTLNVLLTAAFGFTLSRYSGQNDIILGVALANRVRRELEPLVGMFVNTLPLRLDFSGRCPFSEYVSRTSQASTELLKHSQIPFELLVGELEISRELSHQAIFQTAFTLLPPMGKPPEFTNLSAEWIQHKSNISKLDLSLYIEEIDNYLNCLLEYATALYDKKSVERWMGSFLNLLEAVADNPNLIFDESVLISTDDRNLLAAWGQGKQEKIPDISFLESFKQHVAKNPKSIAIVSEKTTLNYAQLDELSDRIAEVLCELNGEVYIGICMKRSPEAIATMLAAWKIGAAYLPMDPSLPLERLNLIIENAKLKTVMVDKKAPPLSEVIPDLRVLNIDDILSNRGVIKNSLSAKLKYSPDLPAYVIYTSGSTGRPKGVVIPHKSMLNSVNWYVNTFPITEIDFVSQIASFSFDASIPEIWSTIYAGARLILVPEDIMIDPRELHDWIVDEKITIHFSPTPLAEELLKLHWEANVNLRILYMGGDVLRVRPSSKCRYKVYNLYGPTENTVISSSSLVLPDRDGLPDIGKPICNVTCHVLKQNGDKLVPVPPGVFGELYVGGENLALGYLNNPELTAQSFFYWSPENYLCGKDQPCAKRIYKTGDIVRFLNDGNLEIKGRVDNQVKIRGYRIELGDIESALKRHPQIKDAIVMAHGKTSLDKQLIAYVKIDDNTQLSKDKIISHLKGVLPAYMLPARIISTNEFPLLTSGKIDRKALFALYLNKAESKKLIPLKNELMKVICSIWEEVLGLSDPGIEENFFDIGGSSLLLIKVRHLLRQHGYKVEVMDLFRYPTISALSNILQGRIITKQDSAPNKNYLSGSGGIIRLRKGNSEAPSLFLVHPVGGGVLCYRDLLSFLTPARSVYGLQSFGLTDSTPPLESIDIMAKYYVKAICDLPVSKAGRVLAGHSFGGLVAFEMARLLDKKGEKPLMTVLIDTPGPGYMPRVFKHDDEFMAYMLVEEDLDKEWDNNLRLIKSLPKKQRLGYVLKKMKQSLPDPDQVKDEVFLRYLDVTRFNIDAMDTYKPEKWDVNILFFKAQEGNKLSALTPEKAWDDLAQGGVEVINVPGNHFSMLSKPNVAIIGNELEKRLSAIPSGKSISNETK